MRVEWLTVDVTFFFFSYVVSFVLLTNYGSLN